MSGSIRVGTVKQVTSGDTIVIRDKPTDKNPNEKTIVLMGIAAPKLGRKWKDNEEKEEPFAWEAREFLRKKLIGKEVTFLSKPFKSPNSQGSSTRELGKVFFPTKEEDIAGELVANGLAKVKKEKASGKQAQEPEVKKLIELEEKAKAEGKGIWSKDKDKHIRSIKYAKDPKEFDNLVKDFKKEPVSAIIESVRERNNKMLVDIILLPSFYSIPLMISGIKFCDDCSYRSEAIYFVESRLLQQNEVQVVIERAVGCVGVGSVRHPKGNIAERLLEEGYMCCDDIKIVTVIAGAARLREAEKKAKEGRLRCWKDLKASTPKAPKKEFQGVVLEIIGGDALMVKVANTGETKKIFLSSIRSPKEAKKVENEVIIQKDNSTRVPRPFDVPWVFEAREFLRKKLIGKKVTVIEDYIQDARDKFPEKTNCTVKVGSTNIAQALVENGLATVIQHRDTDDNRSSEYDDLCMAQEKAKDNKRGIYSKEKPKRITECTGNRAIGFFPMLQKCEHIEGVVEYVISGSRMRLLIPKDSLVIVFLLSGIQCPRARTRAAGRAPQDAELYGEEALNFTKERVMQREVDIKIESHDKKGSMLGRLMVNNVNLALALVEEGLAEVYSSCTNPALFQAEKVAKENKIGIWSAPQKDQKNNEDDDVSERKVDYKEGTVSNLSPELHIFVQHMDEKKDLEELQDKLNQEFASNPPVTFSKEKPPPKGKLVSAKYSKDKKWYRGKVEKVMGGATCKAMVYFVDYGNKEHVPYDELAPLPEALSLYKHFAHEYAFACVTMPPEHYQEDVFWELEREIRDRKLKFNIEYHDHNRLPFVTIVDTETNEEVNKTCIEKGFFYVQNKREKKFQSLMEAYNEAEVKAKKERNLIWEYGDARADEAKEFGLGK